MVHRRQVLGAALLCASPAAAADEPAPLAGGLEKLTGPGGGDNRASFMPDGHRVLFASRRSGRMQIWAIAPSGGAAERVIESGANDFGRVAPSPDGRKLCFSSDRAGENGVFVQDAGSGAVARLSDPRFWSFGPAWSALGAIAYFSRKGGNAINVWTVRADGSEARQVTDRPGESRQPWWSADGRMLALSADGGSGVFQLWVMAADGSGARALTEAGDWQQPVWSPDGRRLAVSRKRAAGRARIVVLAFDGGPAVPIVQPEETDNVHPAWSPDGGSIVFTAGTGMGSALWRFSFA